jgi:hypothetical protein
MSDTLQHARNAVAITPSDTVALPGEPLAIYVGGGGDVYLRAVGSSSDVAFLGVPNGAILPVRATYLRATGTTASDFIALS